MGAPDPVHLVVADDGSEERLPARRWLVGAVLATVVALCGCGQAMEPDEVGTAGADVTMTGGAVRPVEGLTPVVRTDFTDDVGWRAVVAGITAPGEEFTPEEVGLDPSEGPQFARADVRFIERTDLDGATLEEVVADLKKTSDESFAFIVDGTTITDAEHPILCVDFSDEPPVTFRFVPSQAPAIQNNLELANMEAAEFADAADPDGIFRGFSDG